MMAQNIEPQLRLTSSEWQAVAVALRDAEKTIAPQKEGRIARLFGAITGIERPRPLADPRLEAVRRFVWASRRNIGRAREFAKDLRSFGYSCDQIEALRLVSA